MSKSYYISDMKIIEEALRFAYILYISNIPDKEVPLPSDSPGRANSTIEFPTLNIDYFIIRDYWSIYQMRATSQDNTRYAETEYINKVAGQTKGFEIYEMYCGGKSGRKTKVKRRIW